MKKSLFLLFAAAVMFAGCQKDTATNVSITTGDISSINTQLKGTWVFPVKTLSIVDSAGKALAPSLNLTAAALKFDGNHSVDIMPDLSTVEKGTYVLSTKNGLIYADVTYPDGSDILYQILLLDNNSLKLATTEPYVYYSGNTIIAASAVTNTQLQKQNSADLSSNAIRVMVKSDSLYNVGVYVTSATTPGDTALLKNSQVNITGIYNYSFPAKKGDHLTIDIFGSLTKTLFYAYYNGIPLTGRFESAYGEIKTNEGWDVP